MSGKCSKFGLTLCFFLLFSYPPSSRVEKKKKKRIQRNERGNQHNLMGLDTPVSSVTTNGVENEPTAPRVELKKKKKAARGSNLSTNGKTNTAFEPECYDV